MKRLYWRAMGACAFCLCSAIACSLMGCGCTDRQQDAINYLDRQIQDVDGEIWQVQVRLPEDHTKWTQADQDEVAALVRTRASLQADRARLTVAYFNGGVVQPRPKPSATMDDVTGVLGI